MIDNKTWSKNGTGAANRAEAGHTLCCLLRKLPEAGMWCLVKLLVGYGLM